MAALYRSSSPTEPETRPENPPPSESSTQVDSTARRAPESTGSTSIPQSEELQPDRSADGVRSGSRPEALAPQEEPVDGLQEDYRALALGALDFPDMKAIDPADPSYDPRLEAQQAFAPMEADLLAADPLDSGAWRDALERHKLRNLGVSKRAQFLRESGQPELAEDLVLEWGKIYGTWQARAYGRAGPPGYKSPER